MFKKNDRLGSYKVFYDKLTFVTLQMPNFAKEEHELERNFDKWLYEIKNLHKLDHIAEKIPAGRDIDGISPRWGFFGASILMRLP